jgi:hypothetical protein
MDLLGPVRTRSCFSLRELNLLTEEHRLRQAKALLELNLLTEEHRLRQAKALLLMRRTCNLYKGSWQHCDMQGSCLSICSGACSTSGAG